MTVSRKLAGAIRLPLPILVLPDALGETYHGAIASGSIYVSFPIVARGADGVTGFKLAPPPEMESEYFEWIDRAYDGDIDGAWGGRSQNLNSSTGDLVAISVATVAFTAEVQAAENIQSFDLAPQIGAEFDRLFRLVLRWLELEAGVILPAESIDLSSRGHVVDHSTVPPQHTGWGLSFAVRIDRARVSRRMIHDSFGRASSGQSPPVEWAFFLEARRQSDRRRAVIDACTAVEISLSNFVRTNFSKSPTAAVDRIVMGSSQMRV